MQRGRKRSQGDFELVSVVGLEELHASVLVNEESDSKSESQSLNPLDLLLEGANTVPSAETSLSLSQTSIKSQSAKAVVEADGPANAMSRNMQILFQQFKGVPPSNALAVPSNERRFVSICSPNNLLRKIGFCAESVSLGPILFDRNTASVPGLHLPLVLDMVRDSVKNRLLNVLGFACIFCSVILILSSFLFVAPQVAIPNKVRSSCLMLDLCSFILSFR